MGILEDWWQGLKMWGAVRLCELDIPSDNKTNICELPAWNIFFFW